MPLRLAAPLQQGQLQQQQQQISGQRTASRRCRPLLPLLRSGVRSLVATISFQYTPEAIPVAPGLGDDVLHEESGSRENQFTISLRSPPPVTPGLGNDVLHDEDSGSEEKEPPREGVKSRHLLLAVCCSEVRQFRWTGRYRCKRHGHVLQALAVQGPLGER